MISDDHVTLKTGAIAAENSVLPTREYLKKNKNNTCNIKNINCNNITQYYCIFFYQIKAAMLSIRDFLFFQKHKKKLPTPNIWTVV